jgi:MarR family transcriptional regulator for hemolysin
MRSKNKKWQPEVAPTFWINHSSRLIMRHFEKCLRPLDFGMAYMPVAMALGKVGPLLQKDLAERCHVEQPTMAILLGRMERDGIIARKPHPDDKRATLIALTLKGKRLLPKIKRLLIAEAEIATAGLSDEDKAMLISLLRRIVSNLTK